MSEQHEPDGTGPGLAGDYPADMVAFVEARLTEDRNIARLVASDSPTDETAFCLWATSFEDVDPDRLIVAVDYQRVFAELAAKQRILAAFWEVWRHESTAYAAAADYMETVVRELAAVHRDHEDYRSEWSDAPLTDEDKSP